MKRQILTFALALSLGSCVNASAPTIEELIEITKPVTLVEYEGGVALEISYTGFGDERQNRAELSRNLKKEGDYIYVNEKTFYSDDDYSYFYFSTEPGDKLQYQTAATMGTEDVTETTIKALLETSFLGYESFDVEIESVEEDDASYLIHTSIKSGEYEVAKDTVTEEKETGRVTKIERIYAKTEDKQDDQNEISTTVLTYSGDIVAEHLFDAEELASKLVFDTIDVAGNPVNTDIIKDAKLVMVNFWEPWCGPCVGEMPDIQSLYEEYKDQGFLVLGIYSPDNSKETVEEMVEKTGVQYPILQKDKNLAIFSGQFVPVTVFADGNGNVLTEEPLVGARTKEEWNELIQSYL